MPLVVMIQSMQAKQGMLRHLGLDLEEVLSRARVLAVTGSDLHPQIVGHVRPVRSDILAWRNEISIDGWIVVRPGVLVYDVPPSTQANTGL